MARKATTQAPTLVGPEYATETPADLREAEARSAEVAEVIEQHKQLFMRIGQMQAFHINAQFNQVAHLKLLAEIKDMGAYKGVPYVLDGRPSVIQTWAEFCTHIVGLDQNTVSDKLRNLATFGEQFLQSAQQLGLREQQVRKLRRLPDSDEKTAIIQDVEVAVGDKDAIVSLIDDLAARHVKQTAALEKQVSDTQRDLEAARQVSSDRDAKVRALKEQVHKLKHGDIDYPERINELRVETATAAGQALIEVDRLFFICEEIANVPRTRKDDVAEDRLSGDMVLMLIDQVESLYSRMAELVTHVRTTYEGYEVMRNETIANAPEPLDEYL